LSLYFKCALQLSIAVNFLITAPFRHWLHASESFSILTSTTYIIFSTLIIYFKSGDGLVAYS